MGAMEQQEFVTDLPFRGKAPPKLTDVLQPPPPGPDHELLRDSEERFQQMAESINEVFWVCAAKNRQFLYVSPAYEKIWGQRCESLYEDPNSLLQTVVPEDRARLATALAERSLLPKTEIEYRILRPDHSMRWIRTRIFPAQTHGLDVYRVVGVSEDITDRKVAEKSILEISARERRRIGQDLHDSLLQQLTGIAYMNKVLQQQLMQISKQEATDAEYIGELLQEAIQETRNLARGLNPVQLDAHGLMSALRELTRSTEKRSRVPCAFECNGTIKIHDHDAATHLYRIAQEAISNAIKHGFPGRIVLSLAEVHGLLILRVLDDGKGFPEVVPSDAGMGLHIMNYRARMIGATLRVQRDGGGGTLVICSYPNK
jgi:PAS domain S-box-containing protein